MREPGAPPDELKNWLRNTAIQLETAEPGAGFEDLTPLGEQIGNARIVTICEATHGTHEVHQFKHRMLEYLVLEHGFTTLVITGSYSDSYSLFDYVRGVTEDAENALAQMRFWTLDAQELLNAVKWVRTYNDQPDLARKVMVYGCDSAHTSSAHRVVEYLQRVDSDLAAEVRRSLLPIASDFGCSIFKGLTPETRADVESAVKAVTTALDRNATSWAEKTSSLDLARAQLAARCLAQRMPLLQDASVAWEVKDGSTAENIGHILEMEGPDARLVVWTHNGHGQRANWYPGHVSMGGRLDKRFKDDYFLIGTAVGSGEVLAVEPKTGLLNHFALHAPPIGTLDAALAEVGPQIFAVNWRVAPHEGLADTWLAAAPGSRCLGAEYSEDSETLTAIYADYGHPDEFFRNDPRECFDILVFFNQTTPARNNNELLPKRADPVPNSEPVNLDFADLDEGGIPAGWKAQSSRPPADQAFEFTKDVAAMSRHGIPWYHGDGVLSFRLSADRFRDRRIGLSADLSLKCDDQWSMAQLAIVAEDKSKAILTATVVRVSEDIVQSPQTVELDVPSSTETVALYLLLSGNGKAEFGKLKVYS